jgi:hypothetical protein
MSSFGLEFTVRTPQGNNNRMPSRLFVWSENIHQVVHGNVRIEVQGHGLSGFCGVQN